ncbi:MAG: molybdate ABC transporter substrate-binding protein [Alphaproteobacteria bacterium]|nr:molybdate ABC transporter substrate-binding protein [Alphaproteobacteria bacterium]
MAFLAALALFVQPCAAIAQPPVTVTVFAAASLTDSLKAVADAYKAGTGVTVTLSFGASSTLARQIDQGAQADIFMSADTDWMDFLQKGGHIAEGTRKDLLGNQLVLIAASDSKTAPNIVPHFDLAGTLGNGRLALADPASVPAGKYAKAALTSLGVWDSIASKVAPAENVRVALEYVARGEAPFGVVYATDAKVAPSVRIVGTFPENSHAPIVYPVALTRTASPAAKQFLTFLSGASARTIFQRAGFTTR